MENFYTALQQHQARPGNVCITAITGPYAGRHALFSGSALLYADSDGPAWGTVAEAFAAAAAGTLTLPLQGGTYYCEHFVAPERLIICGAGHISLPLVKIGRMLDFEVMVIDDRPDFVKEAAAAGASKAVCLPFAEALGQVQQNPNDYYIIVTRGHQHDKDCLRLILGYEKKYTGMIGSKARVRAIMSEFMKAGDDPKALAEVHSPIGLSIGAQTPEEIAVAIMAEIIQVRNQNGQNTAYPPEVLDALALEDGTQKALVTIVGKKGSAPRETGAKMVVLEDGSIVGTIGGGCVELQVSRLALRSIECGRPFHEEFRLTGDSGMFCGGVIDIFTEPA
ncbi:MAG: XdhC family protein [Oscillospiraceae bacterium]